MGDPGAPSTQSSNRGAVEHHRLPRAASSDVALARAGVTTMGDPGAVCMTPDRVGLVLFALSRASLHIAVLEVGRSDGHGRIQPTHGGAAICWWLPPYQTIGFDGSRR
jgi:hypothetical protein